MTQEQEVEAEDTGELEAAHYPAEAENHQPDAGKPSSLKRLGNVEKCPVCGSDINPEAYHCPTCRNTFCFHCRARVLPNDVQLQCTNQGCSYYGKLLCDVCEESIIEEQPPAVYMEPEEGLWPLFLIVVVIASGFLWSKTSLGWALLFLLLAFPILGYVVHCLGLNVFGRERRVEHRRTTEYYRCILCRQAVKQLSMSTGIRVG